MTHCGSTPLVACPTMRAIGSAEVYLLFKELATEVKVSLRSRGTVDVNAVARRFGGGGHILASGCSLPLPLDQALLQVLTGAREALIEALALAP